MDTSIISLNPNDLFSAEDLVVAITGCDSGMYLPSVSFCLMTYIHRIGLAIDTVLHQPGASHVYIMGRRLSAPQEAARNSGPAAIPVECDVTNPSSVSAVVSKIE